MPSDRRLTSLVRAARNAYSLGILWLAVAGPLCAAKITDGGEEDVLPQPCATDSAYREFEMIQEDAYLSDQGLDFRFLLSPASQREELQKVISELRRRSAYSNGVLSVAPGFESQITTQLAYTKIPTCYENPFLYFMIDKYANDIESARLQLGLRLAEPPKFGSLPSNDINAYMYPSSEGRGGVIALNVQLFSFIYQMTELAASAVDPELSGEKDSMAKIIAQSMMAISYNREAKSQFVNTILGLLLGKSVKRTAISPSDEPLVIFFAGAMERFVFAHEYGHLIEGHRSGKMRLPTGSTGNHEYEVLARTWKQEFEADAVGLQLLIQVLQGSAKENANADRYYIYALKAPLFFFECLELLDRARFMQENGTIPPDLTEKDKTIVRSCADGTIPKSEKRTCANDTLGTHPPAWLRKERLEKTIDARLAHFSSPTAKAAAQKGDELIYSVAIFWDETSRELLRRITEQGDSK